MKRIPSISKIWLYYVSHGMKLISKNNGNFFWLDQKISFSETVKFRLVRNTAHAKLKISLGFAKEIENFDWMNHRVWFTMAYECDPLTYVHRGFPLALRRILRRTVSMGSLCIVVTCLEIRCTPLPLPSQPFLVSPIRVFMNEQGRNIRMSWGKQTKAE